VVTVRTKIILDCDPGHDDALAIMLAHGSDDIDLLAVTTVSGNQDLEKVTHNARVVATVIGMTQVPIAAGCDRPLVRPAVNAPDIHGDSGLDGPVLPAPTVPLSPRHGVDLLIELIMDSAPGEITVVGIGPATNLASALAREPAIAGRVRSVVLMGGAYTRGNVTPAAEFNVYADPQAAAAVLGAPWDVTLIGLDLTHQATATADVRARIAGIGTSPARFAAELLDFYAASYQRAQEMPAPPIHDACAVAYVIDPSVIAMRRAHVDVELAGEHTTGMTVTDFSDRSGERNIDVGVTLDRTKFWDLMTGSLSTIGEPR
jgi:inosine/uridine nucleosidase